MPTYRQTTVELAKRDHGLYQDDDGEVTMTLQMHGADWSHDAAPESIRVTVTPPKPPKTNEGGYRYRRGEGLDATDKAGIAMVALMVAVPVAVQWGPSLSWLLA